MTQNNNSRVKRPFSVTILVVIVLIFTSLNTLQWISAYQNQAFFEMYELDLPILYLIVTGILWMIFGIPLIVGLFFGMRWSYSLVRVYFIVSGLYYWVDRLVVAEPLTIAFRWQFAVVATLVMFVFLFWTLSRPKTKLFFKQSSHTGNSLQTE